MSADWPIYKVADLEAAQKLVVQDGNHGEYRPRKNEFVERGTAFIRAADLGSSAVKFDTAERINDIALKRIRKGIGRDSDTILSTKGTVGKIAFVPKGSPRFVCSPQTSFWRSLDHDFIDPNFLYYELQSRHFLNQISSRKGETDMADYLSLTNQRGLNIRVPDIDKQREAARILGHLDDKIELNRQINQTLEQIAQAIFKSWFVDFEPVKAKIAAKASGRDPERAAMCAISGAVHGCTNVAGARTAGATKTDAELDQLAEEQRQQLAATAALFPDELVESELGLVPVGWEVCPLSKMIKLIGGGTPKKSEPSFWGGDIPWFSVKDAPSDSDVFVLDTCEKITQAGLDKSSTKLLPEGTTIISARGTVGRLALVGTPMAMNQSCYGVVGTQGIGPFYNYFNLKQAVETLQQNTHGAVFDTITRATFETVKTVKGNSDLILIFDDLVSGLMQRIKENLREAAVLLELRDTLLPKLLCGEIILVGEKRLWQSNYQVDGGLNGKEKDFCKLRLRQ